MTTLAASFTSSLLVRAPSMPSTTVFTPPSRVFRTTLPVKPSVTTTSTRSVMTSRPSTLPMKRTSGPAAPSCQEGVSLLYQRVALGGLFANGQEPNARVG